MTWLLYLTLSLSLLASAYCAYLRETVASIQFPRRSDFQSISHFSFQANANEWNWPFRFSFVFGQVMRWRAGCKHVHKLHFSGGSDVGVQRSNTQQPIRLHWPPLRWVIDSFLRRKEELMTVSPNTHRRCGFAERRRREKEQQRKSSNGRRKAGADDASATATAHVHIDDVGGHGGGYPTQ